MKRKNLKQNLQQFKIGNGHYKKEEKVFKVFFLSSFRTAPRY